MASKALVSAAYHAKLRDIAAEPGVERLTVVVPPAWQEPGGRLLRLERSDAIEGAYDLRVEPIRFNGSFHLFYWPTLGRIINEVRPDVVHVDEEPYNWATALAAWQARGAGSAVVFFTWQNLVRRYPPPFRWMEQSVFRQAQHAIVGNAEAGGVLRQKGYAGPISEIPQFGVDPARFVPAEALRHTEVPIIGYVARLVEEKGVFVLIAAMERLQDLAWRLLVVGTGPAEAQARAAIAAAGLDERVTWQASVPSEEMPYTLKQLDLLVLPSLTRPHWKEQFGRVLVEAMACGVPVVGSTSGEIPNVIGNAGTVVPEGDPDALAAGLRPLLVDPRRRQQLGARGRERVIERFTSASVARRTVAAYAAAFEAAQQHGLPRGA